MYRKIIYSKQYSLRVRLKRLLAYYIIRRAAGIQWKKRIKEVFKINPTHRKVSEKELELAHKLYWKPFNSRINIATLRICNNISGIHNYKYIPEEIFVSDIEPSLNQTPTVEYLTYKSFYNHWFPGNIFPKDFFHNIDGQWFNDNLKSISFNEVKNISRNIKYPVVLKPNRDSYGGNNVYFPNNHDALMGLLNDRADFIIQEKIKQHKHFEQYNSCGLNTVRVNLYRSIKDDQLHIVNTVLRMGVGGSLDNETAGGIVCLVKRDGFLNGFAVDKYGKKYMSHPDTGLDFTQKIPDYEKLNELSLSVASKIFYARLIALDLCYDDTGNWRMIEINIFHLTIRFAQYHGSLFFDNFTDEVRDYCLSNHWTLKYR